MVELPGQGFHPFEQLFLLCPLSFLTPGHHQHRVECVDIFGPVPVQQDHRLVQLRLTGFPVATQALQIAQIGKSRGIGIILRDLGTVEQGHSFCGQFFRTRQVIGPLVAARGPAQQVRNQSRIIRQILARVGERGLKHPQRCRRLRADRVHFQRIEPPEQIEQHILASFDPVQSRNRDIPLFANLVCIDRSGQSPAGKTQ